MLGIPFLDEAFWKWFRPQTFDDPIDRLNYFLTSTLLTFFAIMVSAKQYVGSPIQCWMPMEFKGGWEQYAEDYCFIQNTFFVPFSKDIPNDVEDREEAEIGYYQWVPIVLALQAIMFYLPNWLWKTLHKQSGIDLDTAIAEARKLRCDTLDQRRKEVTKLCQYMEEVLEVSETRKSPYRIMCFRMGPGRGSFVTTLYLFVKMLYVFNIFVQFYLMNSFLGSEYSFWGFQTFYDLWNGREWLESGVFPRVTMCDFKIRRLANVHKYTVQCVLMINMFNEKIYLFLWFWLFLVAIATVINFMYCCFQLLPAVCRLKSTKRLIIQSSAYGDDTDNFGIEKVLGKFTESGLKPDGVLLLRFIEGHAGAIVAREIAHKLYTDYLEKQEKQKACSYRGYGNNELHYSAPPVSESTKLTSPGLDGPHEELYPHPKLGLMDPDYPTKPSMA